METANGSNEKAIEALLESRPPATDNFTYLTIIEKFLSPEILPTLNDILQDASLTQEIGWDLVQNLVSLPGSEQCLETVARLGNPREAIVKTLEVIEGLSLSMAEEEEEDEVEDDEEEDGADGADGAAAAAAAAAATDAAASESTRKFITLLGMLAILHKRIKTKYPSRFLASTLVTVRRAYRPNQLMTAAVVNLVQSLAGHRRPPLPTRTSSINVANLDKDGDTSKNAPDPEAEQQASPEETEIQEKLLLSFVLSILEAYVNANPPSWAERLVETYNPHRVVPGKRTALQAFKEEQHLLARDTIVGQLAALARDLGLSDCSKAFLATVCREPLRTRTLPDADELKGPHDIKLPTGGAVCLLAYWVFSSTVFEATTTPKPDIYIFPDHYSLLQRYMSDDAQSQILTTPGTIEAILALGLWLHHEDRLLCPPSASSPTSASPSAISPPQQQQQKPQHFMPYHHLLTLCSVYHPSLQVRSAASSLAGLVLHSDPDDDDRLRILEDLLENCMFAALKACAITWLREELVAAALARAAVANARAASLPSSVAGLGLRNVSVAAESSGSGSGAPAVEKDSASDKNKDKPTTSTTTLAPTTAATARTTRSRGNSRSASIFDGPDAVEQLQYCIFPDMAFVREMDRESFVEYWAQNSPFVMQAANFAYFLFRSDANARMFVPRGMVAAVEERYVRPLLGAAVAFERDELEAAAAAEKKKGGERDDHGHNHDSSGSDPRAMGMDLAMEMSILASRLKSLLTTPPTPMP